jgi:SAM-dependent methyltransferase
MTPMAGKRINPHKKLTMCSSDNSDSATIASFGDEWTRFDQSVLSEDELARAFSVYFKIFPWRAVPESAEGFDMGCGSGRWARLVAPRVGRLNCVDASAEALSIARRTLADHDNVRCYHAPLNAVPLTRASQDFGYSLGVLHHVPDTDAALRACVDLLKPGAPLLVYLFYRFDNRPYWYCAVWRVADTLRAVISRLPSGVKHLATDLIAALIYFPMARLALAGERLGVKVKNVPLYHYRDKSFYTMRTDSRDRFGTPLEKRFTRLEIETMMKGAGLVDIEFLEEEPYWCAVGRKS